jgi:hypothetical protein
MKRRVPSIVALVLGASFLGDVAHAEGRGIRTPEAVKIFNSVCAKTYPRFDRAEAQASALGFNFQEENAKDIWISAFSNSDGRSGCSVSYGTVETVPKLIANLGLLGTVVPTGSLTATVRSKDSKHDIYIRVDDTRKNGRIVVNLRMEQD